MRDAIEQPRRALVFDIAEVRPMLGITDQRGEFGIERPCN